MNPTNVFLAAAICLISTAYSQHSYEFKNLPDNVFCEYVGDWVNRADKLSPGFKWNIDQLCQNGEYVWENEGMFCNSLTSFYGNGESWCSAYGSCHVGAFPDSCEAVSGKVLSDDLDCVNGMVADKRTGFCLE